MNIKVRKAILPVAGLGTRFLPATKAQPKEMLPIVDKPVLQFLVEEAVDAGIEEIIFVTGKGKRAIEDHFDYVPQLEQALLSNGKQELYEKMRTISDMARFTYVRQKEPRGNGDAILVARHLIGDEPVAILFGDDLVKNEEKSCLRQMMEVFETEGNPVVALEKVPRSQVSQYGVVGAKKISDRLYNITSFVEKPRPREAPSTLVAVGKYIVTPALLDELERVKPANDTMEHGIADALATYCKHDRLLGLQFEGQRIDCGSKIGFLKATVLYGLEHPETKKEFKKYLKKIVR